MSIFKKKIDYVQFVADLISFQLDFIESDFDKMIALADEFEVLSENDKGSIYSKLQTLVVTDILLGCHEFFGDNIAPEEINKCVAVMYRRCLVEYKGMPEKEAINKANKVLELIDYIEDTKNDDDQMRSKSNKNGYEMKILNEQDKQKFLLCSGFAIYFAGKNMHDKNYQGRHFAAFKLAKAFIKVDFVKIYGKKYKITWD